MIGPCGSGKSNVLDAILFAMGALDERRKHSVSEVITEDHETHKRLADITEVELIFENTDGVNLENGNELIISRQLRIPASGQFYSIFKMNNKECSKSEILEVLKKYGIEPDGYNIIKQGEISTRMKDTPESRKKLIEIVSGLSQFDPMIADVESKISNARNNLKQTDLLLKESSRHLSDLEKERDRAIEYKKLESNLNKLKALTIKYRKNQYLVEIENLKSEIEKIIKIIQEVESESDKIFKDLKDCENQNDTIQLKIIDFEKKRSNLDGHAKSLDNQIRELEQRIKQNVDKDNFLKKDRMESLGKEIYKFELRKKELTSEIEENVDKNNKLQGNIKQIRDTLDKLDQYLPELQKKSKAILMKMNSLKDEINKQTRLKDKIDKELGELRIHKEGADVKFNEISENMNDKNRKLSQISSEILGLDSRKNSLNKEIDSINKYFQETFEELKTFEENQSLLKRDIETMNSLLEGYESQKKELKPRYSNDIQLLLKERDDGNLPELIGTVLELIDIKELNPNFAKAIEAAGGNFFEHVVVKDFEVAKKVIDFIKIKNLGKIVIYLLDEVKSWNEKELPAIPGIVDKIINLIKFDPKYREILSFIFKDTVVVQDLDIAYNIHGNFRAVTLDGEVIEPKGYIVTQGRFEPKFLLLAEYYKEKIKDLELQISEKNKQFHSINKKIEHIYAKRENDTRKKDDLNRTIGQIEGKKVELVNTQVELDKEIRNIRSEINNLNNAIVDYQVEIQDKQMNLEKAFDTLKTLQQEKEKMDEELRETEYGNVEKDIRDNQNKLKKLRGDVKSLETKRNTFKNQLTDLEKNIAIRRERYNQALSKSDEFKTEKESLEKQMQDLITKMQSEYNEISDLYLEIKSLNEKQKNLKEEIELRKEEQGLKNNEILKLKERINSLNNTIARKEAFIEESENKLKELEVELDDNQKIDIEKINSDMISLENQMKLFGLVDPNAPDKFKKEKLKYEERISKKELYSKELEEAIHTYSDLIEQKKNKFLETLKKINKHLNKIFKNFYQDGSANLYPQDSKDPLNSGIEIEVDLGAGKINNIKSLSGGETSLVAISVILAIQEFEGKSAPFYFLDELDAHLDNAKGEQLAHLIAKMAEEHQYIIVTPKNKYLAKLAHRVFALSKNQGGFSSCQFISQENFEGVKAT